MNEPTSSITDHDAGPWLASIIDNTSDAILSKTLDGVITSWNSGAEKLFGYTREEAIGQPITLIIPDDRLHEETDIIARLRAGERVDRFETVRRRSDGTPVHIEVTISPVRDASGTIIGASKIARDIGERLRNAEDQRVLVREMHHRIKNLLSIVQGLVGATRRRAETVEDFADDLEGRIAALAAAQLLVLAHPDEGEQNTSLSAVIEAVLAPYLGDGRVCIAASDVTVGRGASTSLALLIHELATNAVKYGALSNPAGRLDIDLPVAGDTVVIAWSERGGRADDGEQGFGTELLRAALRGLGGALEQGWQGGARMVTITLPRLRLAV